MGHEQRCHLGGHTVRVWGGARFVWGEVSWTRGGFGGLELRVRSVGGTEDGEGEAVGRLPA